MPGGGSSPPSNVGFTGAQPQIYTPTGQGGADQAYQQLVQQIYNQGFGGIQSMGSGTPASNYWPQTQSSVANLINNPYAGQAQGAANQAALLGQGSGLGDIASGQFLQSLAQQGAAGTGPLGNLANLGTAVTEPMGQLHGAASSILGTAFDPQQELFNQQQDLVGQQAGLANAMAGVSGPYAAGTINNALSNFDINWQNQQLARQAQGIQSADAASLAGGELGNIGAGIQEGALSQIGNLANQAAGLQGTGLNTLLSAGSAPYNTSVGQTQTGLGGIGTGINIGNNAWALPQQTLNDLQSYLQLGQAAGNQGLAASQLGGNQQLQQAQLLGAGLQGVGGLAALGNAASGLGGGYAAANLGNFAGTGLSTGDAAAVAADPSLSLAAYDAAGGAGGGSFLSSLPLVGALS